MHAKKYIFNRDEDDYSKLLNDDESATFHHVVSKVLYVSRRGRVDIEIGISYLCTRVS